MNKGLDGHLGWFMALCKDCDNEGVDLSTMDILAGVKKKIRIQRDAVSDYGDQLSDHAALGESSGPG